MPIMTAKTFCEKLQNIATKYKTLYVMGCFGAPMNALNKARYTKNSPYNKDPIRTSMIMAATSNTFGFDCVNLIKGILWGWSGDVNHTYGGASYASAGVPDTNADGMIRMCSGVTSVFGNIQKGEAVWMPGHIGVYIGNGKVVECTPAFKNSVQITNLGNIGYGAYPSRKWDKHGRLPWIDYADEVKPTAPVSARVAANEISAYFYTAQCECILRDVNGNKIDVIPKGEYAPLTGDFFVQMVSKYEMIGVEWKGKLGYVQADFTIKDNDPYYLIVSEPKKAVKSIKAKMYFMAYGADCIIRDVNGKQIGYIPEKDYAPLTGDFYTAMMNGYEYIGVNYRGCKGYVQADLTTADRDGVFYLLCSEPEKM